MHGFVVNVRMDEVAVMLLLIHNIVLGGCNYIRILQSGHSLSHADTCKNWIGTEALEVLAGWQEISGSHTFPVPATFGMATHGTSNGTESHIDTFIAKFGTLMISDRCYHHTC